MLLVDVVEFMRCHIHPFGVNINYYQKYITQKGTHTANKTISLKLMCIVLLCDSVLTMASELFSGIFTHVLESNY